ncbi:MAG: LemA family protein [Acidobacteriota bacterium]
METWIAIGVGALVLLALYRIYVRVIKTRNAALNALATVDVQLKKRRDLIGNVLTIAKQTMRQEVELIERVTALRQQAAVEPDSGDAGAVKQHLQAENALGQGMQRLFVQAEAYPEAQFVAAMTRAQGTYEEVEGHIAAARRFYNSAVEDLQNAVQIFPSSLVARMLGVEALPFFEIAEEERAPVDASEFFAS